MRVDECVKCVALYAVLDGICEHLTSIYIDGVRQHLTPPKTHFKPFSNGLCLPSACQSRCNTHMSGYLSQGSALLLGS